MEQKAFGVICFGEVLWDILPSGAKPGGAPMNVAYHLQKLGINTALISRVGNDDRGDQLIELLKKNRVGTDLIQRDNQHSTGTVIANIQQDYEVSYEIVHPVAWDYIEWKDTLSAEVQQAQFFLYGSLASRSTQSFNTLQQLIEKAKTRIVDINLRPPWFTQTLVESLLNSVDIVKLNEHELALIAGWYKNLHEMNDQVKYVQDKFSIPTVIVTRGGKGAMVCKEGKLMTQQGYQVNVIDTVGSGDAFLAGFLLKTSQGAEINDCLTYANALGALVASKPGGCPDYKPEEVSFMMDRSFVE